jgi:hypothetical protein
MLLQPLAPQRPADGTPGVAQPPADFFEGQPLLTQFKNLRQDGRRRDEWLLGDSLGGEDAGDLLAVEAGGTADLSRPLALAMKFEYPLA